MYIVRSMTCVCGIFCDYFFRIKDLVLVARNTTRRRTLSSPVLTCRASALPDTASLREHGKTEAENSTNHKSEFSHNKLCCVLLLHVLLFFLSPSCVHVFGDLGHDVRPV